MIHRWENHFLHLCVLLAQMSKDPSTKVGAVIVGPDREVRATGFNGFPRGIADTEARLGDREVKNRLIVHAEMNAVLAAARVGTPINGCTIYLAASSEGKVWGGPPCTRCTVEVIQAGIVEIVTWPFKHIPSRWTEDLALAKQLLKEAGMIYREIIEAPLIPEDQQ